MLILRLPTGLVEVGLHLGGGEGTVNPAIAGAAGVLAEVLAWFRKSSGAALERYLDQRGMGSCLIRLQQHRFVRTRFPKTLCCCSAVGEYCSFAGLS